MQVGMAMRSMSSPAVAQPVRRGATLHRPSSTANHANATTTTSPLARLVLRSSASVPQPNPRPLSTSASTPLTSWQVVRTGVVTRASGGGGSKSVVGAASAASEEIDSGGSGDALSKTLLLGGLFALWYLFNIYFNIANKTVLKAFPFPFTCTTLQFAVGGVLALGMWGLRLHKRPELTRNALVGILPLAVVHTLGNLLTNVSLGKVAVSFTHTIKAMEPFFSVALSAAFLGDIPTLPILLSLIPVVGGVALASLSEPTFNWPGFLAAMGSNITFQSRNVLSKKLMGGKPKTAGGGKMDNINLFSIITIMSFFLLAPVTLMAEGVRFTTANMAAMGIADPSALMVRAMQAAVCFHAYQQVSYMILQRVSPVTHSIGNCVKRVVVIVASVIVFANPVTPVNAAGTALALLGVFAYSQAKRAAVADEKAAKKAE